MKRITPKLTSVLVVTLLLVAAATTAISQEQPKVIDLNALAARGEALANEDPLAQELRNQQSEGAARRGFDIGMAAAEGQTLPGPGKQRLHDSLPQDQQEGFAIAVSFSLERNRNAKFAAIGAAIAQADERVADARNAAPEVFRDRTAVVFYKLGFDIATGIFGDPAQGAQGNTAWGPGSQKIRDSLSRSGQRGFNASVKLHLGQDPPSSTPPSSAPEQRPRKPGEITSTIDNSATPIGNSGKRNPALDKVYGDFSKADDAGEIRCRGGRDKFIFTVENAKLDSTGATINIYLLTFEPGPQAARPNGAGLKPGQCSWADRPMNERFLIRFETPANAQLKQQLHGTPVDTSPTAAERFPDAQTIPAYLNDPAHYWSFFGAKPVNNFFVTTGHKYWKPGIELVRDDSTRVKNDSPYVFEKPTTPRPICDVAREARARNNAAAPGLEERCRADLAARGAAIAQVDPIVAEARAAETDPLYRQGFDIATGIFGDPARGANGNTATGPGSLKIRDSLSAAGQRGFDASVKLHLSRNYKH